MDGWVCDNAILLLDRRWRSTDRAIWGHVTGEWCSGKRNGAGGGEKDVFCAPWPGKTVWSTFKLWLL